VQRSDTRACLPLPSIIWYRYSVRRRKLQSAAPLACRHEITNPDRKSPHPHAGGMSDCIGDRDSAVGDADFTDLLDAGVYMRSSSSIVRTSMDGTSSREASKPTPKL
jgi:hypothetical protein